MNNLLLREVKEIKVRLSSEKVSLSGKEEEFFITKKEHENWGVDLINQINSCI